MSCDYGTYHKLEAAARERGMLWYFECDADNPPPIYDHDDERIRTIKSDPWHNSDLYMERNVEANELAKIWTAQGWHTHVAQFTHVGYLGPRFHNSLAKIIPALDGIGPWTMCPVEFSWAVVFATKNPEDIRFFKYL